MERGKFITFEGPDGSGKSTQINILKKKFEGMGYDVVLTREPGGTAISEKIRDILLDKSNKEMNPVTEALLYAAARAQHVHEKILPALAEGKIVICDRYLHSSIAYQAYGRELGYDMVMAVNNHAINNTMPDLSFFILLPYEQAVQRMKQRNRELDRLEVESMSFFHRVEKAYTDISKRMDNIVVLNALDSIEMIAGQINDHIDERFDF